ncbi:hypothetical protein SGRA_3054 [Saprospira grandis str. Lewin]|uniref:Uncharacterized protein n=1 Tax=Saprospira grandis (strain Lewin) TaxID=984262 RepID=H6KZK6_SAPGL|nr:hypothetical protein SGRA_3054 [Saprospira grandis str. Lewin]
MGLPRPAGGSGCFAARYSLGPAPPLAAGSGLRATAVHPSAKRKAAKAAQRLGLKAKAQK